MGYDRAAYPPTRLDPDETSVGSLPRQPAALNPEPSSSEVAFRHRGWSTNRDHVGLALGRLDPGSRRLSRFAACGSAAWLLRNDDNPPRFRIACCKCRDRFCVPCALERARSTYLAIRQRLAGRTLRFITLTLCSSDADLASQLDRLHKCFRCLRSLPWWRAAVVGGLAVVELTLNPTTRLWHPHLHLIVEGSYVPKPLLSKTWHALTGDSYIVDVKLVSDDSRAAAYLSKYVGKPLPQNVLRDPERLDEAIVALRGRRLILTFGSWFGIPLGCKPPDEAWHIVCSLEKLLADARRGQAYALEILPAICKGDSWPTHSGNPRSPPTAPSPTPTA